MNYIDVDKVIIAEDKELNELLICLICRGIVIDPKECSECQRAFCNSCISKLNKNQCAVCKHKKFKPAHIQTKQSLIGIKFKTECCGEIIKYSEISKHISECKHYKQCENCNKYTLLQDYEEHLNNCKRPITANNIVDISTRTNMISNVRLNNNFMLNPVSDIHEVRQLQPENKICLLCQIYESIRKCNKCNLQICEICTFSPSIIDTIRQKVNPNKDSAGNEQLPFIFYGIKKMKCFQCILF